MNIAGSVLAHSHPHSHILDTNSRYNGDAFTRIIWRRILIKCNENAVKIGAPVV